MWKTEKGGGGGGGTRHVRMQVSGEIVKCFLTLLLLPSCYVLQLLCDVAWSGVQGWGWSCTWLHPCRL